eukprot:1387760-Alexandrium_andersonii.AAC.1
MPPLRGHHPTADRSALAALNRQERRQLALLTAAAESVVHARLERLGLSLAGASAWRVVEPPGHAMGTPRTETASGSP